MTLHISGLPGDPQHLADPLGMHPPHDCPPSTLRDLDPPEHGGRASSGFLPHSPRGPAQSASSARVLNAQAQCSGITSSLPTRLWKSKSFAEEDSQLSPPASKPVRTALHCFLMPSSAFARQLVSEESDHAGITCQALC